MRLLERPDDPITPFLLTNYVTLPAFTTCDEAISRLRNVSNLHDITYLYVTDEANILLGVLPTRRLLSSPPTTLLQAIVPEHLVAIPLNATVRMAVEFFTEHKYLAFPVIDDDRRLVGVIDVTLFTQEVFDMAKRRPVDDLFEGLGVHIANLPSSTAWGAFKFRFPWFLATISSGTLCAGISSVFAKTLEESIILAFFLTLVLGLSESMAVQAMTVAIQWLSASGPGRRKFWTSLIKELASALLLGTGCALVVGAIICFGFHSPHPALVIAASILLCMTGASMLGVCIPTFLHAWKVNFRIAAGPIALALTDLLAITTYLTLSTVFLSR